MGSKATNNNIKSWPAPKKFAHTQHPLRKKFRRKTIEMRAEMIKKSFL
jgi:hypothetical protein